MHLRRPFLFRIEFNPHREAPGRLEPARFRRVLEQPAGAGAARLESLAALLRACPGVYLEICGPGPEAEAVRELLQRAGRLPATQLGICADVPAGDQALGPPGVGLTLRSAP